MCDFNTGGDTAEAPAEAPAAEPAAPEEAADESAATHKERVRQLLMSPAPAVGRSPSSQTRRSAPVAQTAPAPDPAPAPSKPEPQEPDPLSALDRAAASIASMRGTPTAEAAPKPARRKEGAKKQAQAV